MLLADVALRREVQRLHARHAGQRTDRIGRVWIEEAQCRKSEIHWVAERDE